MAGTRMERSERDGVRPRPRVEKGREDDQAIGRLPGVVNDLPEVAPHEWIYIMS